MLEKLKPTGFSDNRPKTYIPQMIIGAILQAISNATDFGFGFFGVIGLIIGITGVANFAVHVKKMFDSIWMGILAFMVGLFIYAGAIFVLSSL